MSIDFEAEKAKDPKFAEYLKDHFADCPGSPTYSLQASKLFDGGNAFIVERHSWLGSSGGIEMSVAIGVFNGAEGKCTFWYVFRDRWSSSNDDWSIYYTEIVDVTRDDNKVAVTAKSRKGNKKTVRFDLIHID